VHESEETLTGEEKRMARYRNELKRNLVPLKKTGRESKGTRRVYRILQREEQKVEGKKENREKKKGAPIFSEGLSLTEKDSDRGEGGEEKGSESRHEEKEGISREKVPLFLIFNASVAP